MNTEHTNLPPTNKPLSMLTLERAAPLLCTLKAIPGPFTVLSSILLCSKKNPSERREEGLGYSIEHKVRKKKMKSPLKLSHAAQTNNRKKNQKAIRQLQEIACLVPGTVSSWIFHNCPEATRADSGEIAVRKHSTSIVVETRARRRIKDRPTFFETKTKKNLTNLFGNPSCFLQASVFTTQFWSTCTAASPPSAPLSLPLTRLSHFRWMQRQTASALFPRRSSYSICPLCVRVSYQLHCKSGATQLYLVLCTATLIQNTTYLMLRLQKTGQHAKRGVGWGGECAEFWVLKGEGQTWFKFAHLNTEVRWHGPFSSGCFSDLLYLQYRLPVFSHFGRNLGAKTMFQNETKKVPICFSPPTLSWFPKKFLTFLLRPTPNFSPRRRHCCAF